MNRFASCLFKIISKYSRAFQMSLCLALLLKNLLTQIYWLCINWGAKAFRKIKSLYVIFVFIISFIPLTTSADGASDEKYGWMDSSITTMGSQVLGCIEVPEFNSFNQSTTSLDLTKVGEWVPTRVFVNQDKLLKLQWNSSGIEVKPRKYIVLFRIDPRFARPVVFIQTYDYNLRKYTTDFKQFDGGNLVNYQADPLLDMTGRIQKYNNFVNFTGRDKIKVYNGDIINISLGDQNDFFGENTDFQDELQNSSSDYKLLYTASPIGNKIIFANADIWCNAIKDQTASTPFKCVAGSYGSSSIVYNQSMIVGNMDEPRFAAIQNSLGECPAGSNTMNTGSLCYYNKGRGVKVTLNGATLKDDATYLFHSNLTNADFFYYKSDASGELDFTTDWQIDSMFTSFSKQLFYNLLNLVSTPAGLANYNNFMVDPEAKFLHFGRYILLVEVGNGDGWISSAQHNDIKLEYLIVPESNTSIPLNTIAGVEFDKDYRGNAGSSGYVWVRVANIDSTIQGKIQVTLTNYAGNSWFSDIVYGKIVNPLQQQFGDLTFIIYSNFINNPVLQLIARLMLTLYVMMYGLYFLAGATQISVSDLITRIIKIAIIVALFSPESWNFFNNNLFSVFVSAINYLMTSVVDASSSATNIFGFVDPIFDKYTNPNFWGLLFIQLLQIHNGVAFFAIMVIYSMLLFFRAVIEVIIGYCLAFIGMSVMISLAPIFITLMLFERTKTIFDNWLSTLFSYAVQPTILLIFFLLIDQMMSQLLGSVVLKACWGMLIPLEFGLDLNNLGIPISFSFTLPFLPGIPFYIPQIAQMQSAADPLNLSGTLLTLVTSSLLFYCYCLMSSGLVDYVTSIIARLTNVEPARKQGAYQAAANPTAEIIGDMKSAVSPVTDTVGKGANIFKRKVINQDYSVAEGGEGGSSSENYYSNKIRGGSRFDVSKESDSSESKPASKDEGDKK